MPKRKRLWKHKVPVVELLSIINIHCVHSNKDFKVFGWVVIVFLQKLVFSIECHLFVVVHSGLCLAPFAERCPVGFPGAPRGSGQQPAPQLPEPSGASQHKGTHPHLHAAQMAHSIHLLLVFRRSDLYLHLLGSINCEEGFWFRIFICVSLNIGTNISSTGLSVLCC